MPHWRDFTDQAIEFLTGTSVARRSDRRFGTVLFTDIVNSTRRSSEMGDEKWHAALDSHDRISRRLIDEHLGRVIKSTGDGLLSMFQAPSEGIGCGLDLCSALDGIELTIRAGVHAGHGTDRQMRS